MMSQYSFRGIGSPSRRRHHFVLALIGLISALAIYRFALHSHPTGDTIQKWADEEDQLARDRFFHLSLVEYSRWEIAQARAMSTKFVDDQHDLPTRQSWALTVLLTDSFSDNEQNLIDLFSEAKGLPGRLYTLFLIRERAPSIYCAMKAHLSGEMESEVVYLRHDLLHRIPAREIVHWIESGRFSHDSVLSFRDVLRNWRCWSQSTSVNMQYENWHLRHWNVGIESPGPTVLEGLPPRVSELERKGVRPERRSGKRETSGWRIRRRLDRTRN